MENVRGEGGGERRTEGGGTLNAVVCVLRTSHIIFNMGGMMSMDLISLLFRYNRTSWNLAVDILNVIGMCFFVFFVGVIGSQLHVLCFYYISAP